MVKTDPDPILMTFGISLREIRKSRGLSQEEFAHQCCLDRTYVSGLERGKRNPTLKVLAIVASNLDITISELLLCIKKNQGGKNGKDPKNRD